MNGSSGGVSAVATSMALLAMHRVNETGNTSRRNLHRGADQVLLKVKGTPAEAKRKLASSFKDWAVVDGELCEKPSGFSSAATINGGIGAFLLGLVVWLISDASYNLLNIAILAAVVGFILGFIFGRLYSSVDSVKISSDRVNDITKIVVKIYDSDGYRNFDEDELDDLVGLFTPRRKRRIK
jgi:membrane associated rhomboid family serine protease